MSLTHTMLHPTPDQQLLKEYRQITEIAPIIDLVEVLQDTSMGYITQKDENGMLALPPDHITHVLFVHNHLVMLLLKMDLILSDLQKKEP